MLCIDSNDIFLRKDFFTCDSEKGISLTALLKKLAPPTTNNNTNNMTSHYIKMGADDNLKSILLSSTLTTPIKFNSTDSVNVTFDDSTNTFEFTASGIGTDSLLQLSDGNSNTKQLQFNNPSQPAELILRGQGNVNVVYDTVSNIFDFSLDNGVYTNTDNTFSGLQTFQNDIGGTKWSIFSSTGRIVLDNNLISSNGSGELTAVSFKKSGGLSTQFLKADGSVDSNTYLTSISGLNISLLNNDTGFITSAALSGYLTSATAASTYVALAGSYTNPSWLTSIPFSKLTSTPTTLSGYGITDAFSKVGDTLTGTGGNGFFGAISQSVKPSTPSSGFRLYADASNRFSWIGTNGFIRTFDGTSNTADRSYTLPNYDGIFLVYGNINTLGSSSLLFSTSNTGSGNTFLNLTNGSSVDVFKIFADGTLNHAQSRTGLTANTTISSFVPTIGLTNSDSTTAKVVAYSINPAAVTGTGYTNKTVVALQLNPNSRKLVSGTGNKFRTLEIFTGENESDDGLAVFNGAASSIRFYRAGSRVDMGIFTSSTQEAGTLLHSGSGSNQGFFLRSAVGTLGVIAQQNLAATTGTNIFTLSHSSVNGHLAMGSGISTVNFIGANVSLGTAGTTWTAGTSGTTVVGLNWNLPVFYTASTNYSTSSIYLLGDFDITETVNAGATRANYYGFRFKNTRFMSGLNLSNTAPQAVLDLGQHSDTSIPTLRIAESNTTAPSNTTTPVAWCRIVVNGVSYRTPLYQ